MRQIDADALKKEFCKDIMGGLNWERIIDDAPTVKGKLSDKQIEEIVDLLENEWGYEGMREDVTRILRGAEK